MKGYCCKARYQDSQHDRELPHTRSFSCDDRVQGRGVPTDACRCQHQGHGASASAADAIQQPDCVVEHDQFTERNKTGNTHYNTGIMYR